MRVHAVLSGGALLVALWVAACTGEVGRRPPVDSGQPSGPGRDAGDGGSPLPDGGLNTTPSDFTCNVAKQEGCGAGTTCLFAQLADGGTGSRCFAGACDAVRQDCPAGQRCTYATTSAGVTQRQCVAEGTTDEGGACTMSPDVSGPSFDTCKKGLFCKDEALTDGGTGFFCRRLCDANTQCSAGTECNTVLRLQGTLELPLLCGPPARPCDALGQDCAAPLACYPSTQGPVCASRGTLSEGAACDFSNQCAPGSTCVRSGTELLCRPLCRFPTGSPACASGTCRPVDNNPNVGACVP
ncbi:hypothetical protein DRW03_24225 [Corallococcus sp. H22C18031201]|nr:hypothetical protein DRW03_24225 [Corallococcus sp. H22C18031201]